MNKASFLDNKQLSVKLRTIKREGVFLSDIRSIFKADDHVFTIFVVEQRFVVGRGYDFFRSYLNTSNYFRSDDEIKRRFASIIDNIEKRISPVSSLISIFTASKKIASIADIVTSLCKLFTVHEHQAAGPDVIDPIILQEGKITKRALSKLINLNRDSILQPSIILLLKDNDFERAKSLLSECPNGINIKMIRNSGEKEIYKVINCGAKNIDMFINAYSDQCYSTCSNTRREVLLNSAWANNLTISRYSPFLLKVRSNLLCDEKEEIKQELSDFINSLSNELAKPDGNMHIILCMKCIALLFRVFCNDYGGADILEALEIAKKLNNEVLFAHVYRYAEFLSGFSTEEKDKLYLKGYEIFKRNQMEDHAIYCKNNMLIEQFYTDRVFPEAFRELQVEAMNNVPGLVGMSHIFNNTGLAYLYCGQSSLSIDFFTKGLDYAKYQDRLVQNIALESNRLIAESYSFCHLDENRLYMLLRKLFDGMSINRLPFLGADYALNILSVAYRQNAQLGRELLYMFPVKQLVDLSFKVNPMGSTERLLHMQYLDAHYPNHFTLLSDCSIPSYVNTQSASGKKKDFISKYGFNPCEFNTWL